MYFEGVASDREAAIQRVVWVSARQREVVKRSVCQVLKVEVDCTIGACIQEYLDRQVIRRAVLEDREAQVHKAGARYVVVRAEVLRSRADLRVDVVVYFDDLCVLVETSVVIHLAPEVIDAVADVLEGQRYVVRFGLVVIPVDERVTTRAVQYPYGLVAWLVVTIFVTAYYKRVRFPVVLAPVHYLPLTEDLVALVS